MAKMRLVRGPPFLSFVPVCPPLRRARSQIYRTAFVPHHTLSESNLLARKRARASIPCCTVEAGPSRVEVIKHGINAAVEDFVKSGLNICVGGGKKEDVTRLVDALDSLNQVEGLIDVAFVSASPFTKTMLDERELPSDLGVNFKSTIDLFIAIVSGMDEDCNAVLDSDNIPGEKYAVHVADRVVLVVHEDDVEQCKSGLRSVPIQMVNFQPNLAAESLCSGSLVEFGIRGATLRSDGSFIADLSLAPHVHPQTLEHELCRLPQVVAPGILPATEKTTAVVATRDLQPIDMTPSLHSVVALSEESGTSEITEKRREELLGKYAKDWNVLVEDNFKVLSRNFKFSNAESAKAFVRYVQYVSGAARYFPEITHANTQVEVSLKTEGSSGITELDTLVSKEIASVYDKMFSSSRMMI